MGRQKKQNPENSIRIQGAKVNMDRKKTKHPKLVSNNIDNIQRRQSYPNAERNAKGNNKTILQFPMVPEKIARNKLIASQEKGGISMPDVETRTNACQMEKNPCPKKARSTNRNLAPLRCL